MTSVKNKLKIGFVLDDSMDSSDGVQQYVNTISSWLREQGHDCSFIVGHSKTHGDEQIYSLSRLIKLSFNKNSVATPLPARKSRVKQLFKENDFDILHVQMPYSPFLAGKVIRLAPAETAVVGTFHILPFGKLNTSANRLLAASLKPTLRRFDRVVSVSPAAQTFAKETYGIQSEVVPNAVDARRFVTKRSLSSVEPDCLRIVFLGRLVERKGVKQLLEAIVLLQASQPRLAHKIECVIGGKGKLDASLQHYAKTHKIDHLVQFIGFVAEEDKPTLLASADIAVFPALGGESFGIVLLEAMAAGAGVVIGGDNPGYRSVLGEKPQLLVDPNDTRAFANLLVHMLQNTQTREDIHRWQQRTVRQYDVAQVGPKLLSCYQSAIEQRKKG